MKAVDETKIDQTQPTKAVEELIVDPYGIYPATEEVKSNDEMTEEDSLPEPAKPIDETPATLPVQEEPENIDSSVYKIATLGSDDKYYETFTVEYLAGIPIAKTDDLVVRSEEIEVTKDDLIVQEPFIELIFTNNFVNKLRYNYMRENNENIENAIQQVDKFINDSKQSGKLLISGEKLKQFVWVCKAIAYMYGLQGSKAKKTDPDYNTSSYNLAAFAINSKLGKQILTYAPMKSVSHLGAALEGSYKRSPDVKEIAEELYKIQDSKPVQKAQSNTSTEQTTTEQTTSSSLSNKNKQKEKSTKKAQSSSSLLPPAPQTEKSTKKAQSSSSYTLLEDSENPYDDETQNIQVLNMQPTDQQTQTVKPKKVKLSQIISKK